MNSFPKKPQPVDPTFSWLGRLVSAAERQIPGNSNTLSIRNSHGGTTIELPYNLLSRETSLWGGNYVDGYGYPMNVFVKVLTYKEYKIDGHSYASFPGTYLCVSPVIAKVDTTHLTGLVRSIYQVSNQSEKIVYAPIHPPVSETLAHETEDGKGKYWEYFAPLPTLVNICEDDNSVQYYVAAAKSGSL